MVWLVSLVVLYGVLVFALSRATPDPVWDWSGFDPSAIRFPPDFLWGVAAAAHQVDGGTTNNNWSRWETLTGPDGKPRIADGHKAGLACDHWNRWPEDIGLIQALGVRAYRFSLEWSRLEPSPGVWDEAAIAHYHALIDALRAAGLEPMVTLHHFTHPLWFEDLGSFEKEENLAHFVRFSERMFREYGAKVRLWCTINEPAVFATQGWFGGIFPPGKKDPQLTGVVLCNLVLAHARVYRALKALPGGAEAEIGLVKNLFQFDPLRRWHLGDLLISRALDRVFNGAILDALHTGHFRLVIPGLISVERRMVEAAASLDFAGLNYYSRFHVKFKLDPAEPFTMVQRSQDVQTDMPYPIYPEGFHRALVRLGALRAPLYVTENGIADAADDRRATFIQRYLYAMQRAMADGVPVRGYFYWSLMDNFEWAEGWHMKFGLYEMNPETRERRLRDGSKAYVEIVRRSQHV